MSDSEDFNENVNRRQYLITYSKADLQKFPTRQSFGEDIVSCLNNTGKVRVEYWAVSKEPHPNTSGFHYHMSVKLTGPKRWRPVKMKILEKLGIVVNFSDRHDCYYSAYSYVSKQDVDKYESPDHPNLVALGSPATKKCIKAYKEKCSKRKSEESNVNNNKKSQKKKKLSAVDISDFIIEYNIKDEEKLMSIANQRKKAGQRDLAKFICRRTPKSRRDLIETTWLMEEAPERIRRRNMSRMDVIVENSSSECVLGCSGQWFECALEVLQQNRIYPPSFSRAMRELLTKGRGKHRNIMVIGPKDCGKTFLFKPFDKLFHTFSNPSDDKYCWIGAESAQIIFLNDFRWSREKIAWQELLLLLEGEKVHLPSPKNHYAKDLCISSDVPILATSKERITYVGRNFQTDPVENAMMDARWKYFEFFYSIPPEDQISLTPCGKCFSELILLEEL